MKQLEGKTRKNGVFKTEVAKPKGLRRLKIAMPLVAALALPLIGGGCQREKSPEKEKQEMMQELDQIIGTLEGTIKTVEKKKTEHHQKLEAELKKLEMKFAGKGNKEMDEQLGKLRALLDEGKHEELGKELGKFIVKINTKLESAGQ